VKRKVPKNKKKETGFEGGAWGARPANSRLCDDYVASRQPKELEATHCRLAWH